MLVPARIGATITLAPVTLNALLVTSSEMKQIKEYVNPATSIVRPVWELPHFALVATHQGT